MSGFSEFVASIESLGIPYNEDALTLQEKYQIGEVFDNVKTFLIDNNLVASSESFSLDRLDVPVRGFDNSVDLSNIGPERILALCESCKIPDKYIGAAVESVALCIENYRSNYNSGLHFKTGGLPESNDVVMKSVSDYVSPVASDLVMDPVAALESFGTYTDNTIVDAKVAITVTLLRYHRGTIHRFIPNVPTDSNVITYKVTHSEVYDLTKSRDNDAAVRYDDKHRVPFVDLYRDPTPANTTSKPIILRTANDAPAPDNKLIAENIVKLNTEINMFDYTLDPNMIGYQAIDYTDLVSEGARLKTLIVEVSDAVAGVTELIPVSVVNASGSRFVMSGNAADSADRVCNVDTFTTANNTTLQIDGTVSSLLGALSADAFVKFNLTAMGTLNLKTSNAIVHGSLKNIALQTLSGNTPIAADQTAFDALTFTLVGYEIDASFSEENVRKTTKAMRIMTKLLGYEIPGTSSVVVQYSQNDSRPEEVIDGLAKLLSIGNDDRGIKIIMDTMGQVYDRLQAENAVTDENYTKRIVNDFAASQKVVPTIIMDNISIGTSVANMRSEELWGDIRAVVEKALMEILIRIDSNSFYSYALDPGEKPVYKVLTSAYILGGLLSVPHYHDILRDTSADAVNDGVVEFRRTLPNGYVLDVITTTFDYMADKMIIVPNRPKAPRSELNFAQNVERGTYVTQATPVVSNSIYNQLVANAREFPIVTNPIGAIVQVTGLSSVFDGIFSLGI